MRPARPGPRGIDLVIPLSLAAGSMALFLVSAVLAASISYDRRAAGAELASLCAGLAAAVALSIGARWRPRTLLTLAGMAAGVLALGVVVWGAVAGPVGRVTSTAVLTVLLPLSLCGTAGAGPPWVRAVSRFAAGPAIVAVLAVLAGRELSAIMGIVAATAIGWWIWKRSDPVASVGSVRMLDASALAVVAIGVMTYGAFGFGTLPVSSQLLPADLLSRRGVWMDAWTMIGDYAFTGSGLDGAAMTLSSYAWLRHVPFHPHVHHVLLQVGLEQGVPGMIALVGLLGASIWIVMASRSMNDRPWRVLVAATGAALASLSVAGAMESELSGSAWQGVLLVPCGFAAAIGVGVRRAGRGTRVRSRSVRWALGAGLAPVVASFAALAPGGVAHLHASQGAVLQTRAELGVYRWPEWSVQDRLRRERVVDLDPALEQFKRALSLNPYEVTALRRLGQIQLSRGDYAGASELLRRAWRHATSDQPAERLLAEAEALTGNAAAAGALWAATGMTVDELRARLWWYEHVGPVADAERFKAAVDRYHAGAERR